MNRFQGLRTFVLAVVLFIWWRLGTPGRPGKADKPGDDPVA
jgi:hypothetical protein